MYLVAIVAVHTEENEPLKIWGDLFSLFSSLLSRDEPGCAACCAALSGGEGEPRVRRRLLP